MSAAEIDLNEAVEKMVDAGYDFDEIHEKFVTWVLRGDDVVIFENRDLSHRDLGHRMAMPWYPDEPDPKQAPDTKVGLGWRYPPAYRVKSSNPHNNQRSKEQNPA